MSRGNPQLSMPEKNTNSRDLHSPHMLLSQARAVLPLQYRLYFDCYEYMETSQVLLKISKSSELLNKHSHFSLFSHPKFSLLSSMLYLEEPHLWLFCVVLSLIQKDLFDCLPLVLVDQAAPCLPRHSSWEVTQRSK